MNIIRDTHVGTVRNGQSDPFSGHGYSEIRHDGKTYYYDLAGLDVSADAFEAFAAINFDDSMTVTAMDDGSFVAQA